MNVKLNLRIITKKHAADSKIGSPLSTDFRADGTHESHPTAWELITRDSVKSYFIRFLQSNFQAYKNLHLKICNILYVNLSTRDFLELTLDAGFSFFGNCKLDKNRSR